MPWHKPAAHGGKLIFGCSSHCKFTSSSGKCKTKKINLNFGRLFLVSWALFWLIRLLEKGFLVGHESPNWIGYQDFSGTINFFKETFNLF